MRLILVLMAAALGAEAQTYYAVNGACTLGGQATVMQGMASSGTKPLRGSATFNGTGVMASYPGCTVTVFQTGTNTPVLIYSTAIGGSRSNPFTADLTDGSWVFFAAAGCYDIMISSGATQASTMPNPKTFPGVCAGAGGGSGGGGTGGTSVTVNGTMAIPNQLNFTNTLLVPTGSTAVNFLLNGNTVGAYVTGTGGGGGGSLPTTPQWDLFGSTGAGGAQASGILGGSGFMKAQVVLATGDVTSAAAPFQLAPNASVEYFPSGASFGGITIGATNGLAAYFSHSGKTGAAPGYGNGGLMLGGGNSSGTNYQVYVDCESAPALGCDFKVPITVNGSSVGGGGGGSLPTIPVWNLFASTGSGGAQDSGVGAEAGYVRAQVLEASGSTGAAPSGFTPPNGSIEYFPAGATYGGLNIGAANGVAIHFSHSNVSGQAGNGGIALAGGNASGVGTSYQIFLDCEQATGCDFKVPPTYLGSSLGGGGTAGVSSINGTAGAFNFTGAVSCATTTCNFTGGGGGSGTVSSGTGGHFTWYAATGTTVSSNANLDDDLTTPSTITSQEPIAAPQINVNGAVGTGIAMTGAGGTLPTPASGQGGIGIGPGNVPSYYSNGGSWTAIGSGGVTLPACSATPANSCVLASNAAGTAAVDTGVKASGGFIQSGASIVNGTAASSPFTGANASQEFYAAGGTITPSTGSPITFTNGAALFMGHGASTAGAAGDGGIALGGGSATPTQRIYLDCEVAGCDFKVPVTQGGNPIGGSSGGGTIATTSANSLLAYYPGTWVASASYLVNSIIRDSNNNLQRVTTAGTSGASAPSWSTTQNTTTNDGTGTLVWTLIQVGSGSTTVVPVPGGAFASFFTNGLSFGSGGVLQWGTSATAVDTGLTRVAPGVAAVGNGGQTSTAGYLYGANSCTITSPSTFSGSQTLCQRLLPSSTSGLTWILHCALPWSFTAAGGAATVSASIGYGITATTAMTFTWSNTNQGAAAGTTVVPAATGIFPLFTTPSISSPDTTAAGTSTIFIDGLVASSAAGGSLYLRFTTSAGTAQINAGGYCRIE